MRLFNNMILMIYLQFICFDLVHLGKYYYS